MSKTLGRLAAEPYSLLIHRKVCNSLDVRDIYTSIGLRWRTRAG